MYDQIPITGAVHREVVTEEIVLGKMDAFLIEKEIGDWIEAVNPKGCAGEICSQYRIHIGEAESILLARELDAEFRFEIDHGIVSAGCKRGIPDGHRGYHAIHDGCGLDRTQKIKSIVPYLSSIRTLSTSSIR